MIRSVMLRYVTLRYVTLLYATLRYITLYYVILCLNKHKLKSKHEYNSAGTLRYTDVKITHMRVFLLTASCAQFSNLLVSQVSL